MLRRRVVICQGHLDDELAVQTATQLVALDIGAAEPIHLNITSDAGTLDGAFTLIDAMAMISSPLHITCLGRVEGAAVAVLAMGAHRRAAPSPIDPRPFQCAEK